MTDRVEDLVVHIDLNTVETFLTIDDCIVPIETSGVELLFITVPSVAPNNRQINVANSDDGIDERMNTQLQHGRTVTSFRRACIMRIRACSSIGVPVELVSLTFENRLTNDVVERLINGQDQGDDTITTVSSPQRVTVDACLVVGITLEVVTCPFAHRMTDGVEDLVVDIDLNTVEAFLTVDGCIVSIETSGVELLFITVPSVAPNNRQINVANSDDGIDERMNTELQYGRTIASFRCACIMRIRA